MSKEINERKNVLFTQTEVDILDKVGKYKQDWWRKYHNLIDIDRTLGVEVKETVRIAFFSGI